MSEHPPHPVRDDPADGWSLPYDRFDPTSETLREALCTLGNGYFATRGSAPESTADGAHYPGTYVAGVFNRRPTTIAGRTVENESIVNLPNWLPLTFRIDGDGWFTLEDVELLEYGQTLDLRRGILTRRLRVRDAAGRTTSVHQRRFVSMADSHVAGLETVVTAEDWSGMLTVRSGLDGGITNSGVERYRQFDNDHLTGVETHALDDGLIALEARTNQSDIRVAEAARTRLVRDGGGERPRSQVVRGERSIAEELTTSIHRAESVTVEKVVTLFTSRDNAISEPRLEAVQWLGRQPGLDELMDRHTRAWSTLWDESSLVLEDGDAETQLAVRLHIFHLLQTISPNSLDLDVGVPARGLHGEAYRGHVFWDELFVFPYLNLHHPQLTRSLLLYRWRRLPEARQAAMACGAPGAMYPWQSGSNGREETQVVHLNPLSGRWLTDSSHLQRHVGLAIAYNFWKYYQATDDLGFVADFGAEVIFEISRFWAGLAEYDQSTDRYQIRGVMGPDEYHDGYPGAAAPGLDNNSYTNVMVVWVLCRALEIVQLLDGPKMDELRTRLGLGDEDLARWEAVSRKMRLVFHADGILSQFEGYEDLAELEWDHYRQRYGDISRLDRILESEGDSPNAYKVSKQADVLMLFYLLSADEFGGIQERLGYRVEPEAITRTIDYYLRRTAHGSTLSRVVHAWVLARSDREGSWRLFEEALRGDLDDIQNGTTAEGIHLGAMAGTVDLLFRCYLGIQTRGDMLWFDPELPAELDRLEVRFQYRSQRMHLTVTGRQLTVALDPGSRRPVRMGSGDRRVELAPGEVWYLEL
jgi:trehalose/maltose hydrolase-like predicted phosphorylase